MGLELNGAVNFVGDYVERISDIVPVFGEVLDIATLLGNQEVFQGYPHIGLAIEIADEVKLFAEPNRLCLLQIFDFHTVDEFTFTLFKL